MKIRGFPAVWGPFSDAELGPDDWYVVPRLHEALKAWRDTPYRSGQHCRGVAADCIGSVCGCVDDIDGRPRAQGPSIPADTALHDPATARKAVATLRRAYAPASRVRDGRLQPFDLVVVGASGGGPGHLMLVGPRKNTLWHSTREAGFHEAGWCLGDGYEVLHAAYRLSDRWRWLR